MSGEPDVRGLRCHALEWCIEAPPTSSRALRSRPEYEPCRFAPSDPCGPARTGTFTRHPSMGFLGPPTSSNRGSDLRRAYLTRLCSALRLSQPLDALLRLDPIGLVSCRSVPGLSAFRGFPLPVAATPLGAPCPPCRSAAGSLRQPRLRGFVHPEDPYRRAGVTRCPSADPLLAVHPPRSLPSVLDSVLPQSLLSWASHVPDRGASAFGPEVVPLRPAVAVCALQSIKEPKVRPSLSRRTSLHGLWRPRRAEARDRKSVV